ncbi:MAG: replication initiator protein A [Fuerstiella sp.]
MKHGTTNRRPETDSARPEAMAGRDELNLVDFPIGVLRHQQPVDADGRRLEELVFSVDAFTDSVGKIVPQKVTIRTSSKFGFPTPKEEELLIGLMLFCRSRNNFTEAKTKFQVSEMLGTLGWPDNGRSRRQLREGLDRLAGVRLKFENSWSTDEGKQYEREFNTGILDSYELRVANDGQGADSRELTAIQWSAEVFADIQRGNVKELNTAEFFSLERPLSRRLYRYLDKHLKAGQWFEMDLLRFAAHLGITEKSHIGKIRERLKKPILELEQRGTLFEPLLDAERYHRLGTGHWLIRFRRVTGNRSETTTQRDLSAPQVSQNAGEKALQQPSPHPANRRGNKKRFSDADRKLVQEFYHLWSDNAEHEPTFHECQQAHSVIQQYGAAKAMELLPAVIKLMKQRFPDATSFGATKTYWSLANQKTKAGQSTRQLEATQSDSDRKEEQRRQQEHQRKQQLHTEWNQLDELAQAAIRDEVLQHCTDFVRRKIEQQEYTDSLVMLACLNRLDQKQSSAESTPF